MSMKKLLSLMAGLALMTLSSCASWNGHAPVPAPVADRTTHPLILISIDAFRADYYDRGLTPNLKALAEGGAHAAMHPSFPSLTFPNHYTLITGRRPDETGVVANKMYDPTHPPVAGDADPARFSTAKASDGFWWRGAKPMWVSAEQAGNKTGVVYWPSSEAEIDGTRPSHYLTYQKVATADFRVQQILQWMDLPVAERPGVFMLYFDMVDTAGHDFGPDSPEVNAAMTEVDTAIGTLRAGLQARGVDPDIIVVSDHGMTNISKARTYYVSDLLGAAGLDPAAKKDPRYDFVNNGSVAMLNPAPGYEVALDKVLIKTHYDHMQCWHKGDIPARLHFGKNRRVPQIVCLADLGWLVGDVEANGPGYNAGAHGYDPAFADMNAIFIANGPDFKPGVQLPIFDNVDVYDLEMKLIGLKPEPNDGSLAPFKAALAH